MKEYSELSYYDSRSAARTYYVDLAYHNWDDHVEPMLEYAKIEANRLKDLGVEIDIGVVTDAVMWHDADYALDAAQYGFDSKESLSAWLAAEHLREIGRDEEHIEKVVHCIWATQIGQPRPSNEATLVVAADMHNVAGDQSQFIINGLRLAVEQLQLGNVLPSDATTFMQNSAKFLDMYFNSPFVYEKTDGTTIEMTVFSDFARRNIGFMRSLGVKALSLIPMSERFIPDQWK